MRALLVLALPLVATSALAQEVDRGDRRLDLVGQSPSACVMQAPRAMDASNATFAATGDSAGQILISQFVDPQTANPLGSSIALSFPVICNAAHQLAVRSSNGGLLREGGSTAKRQSVGGFGDFVSYTLSMDWGQQSLTRASDEGAMILSTANARAGELALRIATAPGGGPLAAGRYDDTIIVEFSAAN